MAVDIIVRFALALWDGNSQGRPGSTESHQSRVSLGCCRSRNGRKMERGSSQRVEVAKMSLRSGYLRGLGTDTRHSRSTSCEQVFEASTIPQLMCPMFSWPRDVERFGSMYVELYFNFCAVLSFLVSSYQRVHPCNLSLQKKKSTSM